MPLEDARLTEIEADLLSGEKLLIRMVDNDNEHLAGSAVDESHWPVNLADDTMKATQYWLYVPIDRLKRKDQ
jgi:hypothetical protein